MFMGLLQGKASSLLLENTDYSSKKCGAREGNILE